MKGIHLAIVVNRIYMEDIAPKHRYIAVDTNGAGDILGASFLSKIVSGYNYSSAMQVAVDLASLSVTQENVRHILK